MNMDSERTLQFPKDYRVSKWNPCPVCGKPDWCLTCPDWTICMRIPNARPTRNGGYFYPTNGERVPLAPPKKPTKDELEPAPDEVLHIYYSRLLAKLKPLEISNVKLWPDGTEESRLARVLRPQENLPSCYLVEDWGYAECEEGLPEEWGVPGLYYDKRARAARWVFQPGIWIPVMHTGRYVGVVVKTGLPDKKYVWLSSAGRPRGCKAIARAAEFGHGSVRFVVEGTLKAYRVACFGYPTLGVPGSSMWPNVIPKHVATHREKHLLAPDLDWVCNPHVAQALYNTCSILRLLVPEVFLAYWHHWVGPDGELGPKGPDDALLEGERLYIKRLRSYLREFKTHMSTQGARQLWAIG